MLTKTITYVDHDGTTQTKEFLFNLTKAEAVEINLMEDLESVGNSQNPKAIIPVFKRIIHYAYGVRAANGAFDKDPERTAGFLASDAYSELFLELLRQGETAVTDFIRAVVGFSPEELKRAQEDVAAGRNPDRPQPQDYKPSARDIAQQVKASKIESLATDPQVDSVAVKTEINHGNSDQYQKFLEWQAQQAQQAQTEPSTSRNLFEGSEASNNRNVFEDSPATPEAIEIVSPIVLEEQTPVQQRLRRDTADDHRIN